MNNSGRSHSQILLVLRLLIFGEIWYYNASLRDTKKKIFDTAVEDFVFSIKGWIVQYSY
jgi:hypothetical protein